MIATCYTDASYSPKHGGAWAVWVRSDHGRLVRHGRCPRWVKDSGAAELAAVYAGIFLAHRAWSSELRRILVKSDSMDALAAATSLDKPRKNPAMRRIQARLRELLAASPLSIETQWVRGHRPRESGVSAYLNDACDRLARRARVQNAGRATPRAHSPLGGDDAGSDPWKTST
jgi:ribonuclease HI